MMEPVKSSIPISGLPDNTPGSPGFYHGKLFTNSNLEQPSGLAFYSMFCDGFLLNCSDLGQHKVSLSLFCGLIPGLADSVRDRLLDLDTALRTRLRLRFDLRAGWGSVVTWTFASRGQHDSAFRLARSHLTTRSPSHLATRSPR